MLITFDSKAGRLTMFGEVAIHLLKMMGHSGTVPSAITAAEIPAALARLEKALENPPPLPGKPDAAPKQDDREDDAEREPPVSLQMRAYPLVQLLKAAVAKKADVLWADERATPLKF